MNAVTGGLPGGFGLVVGGKHVHVLGPAAQTGQVQVLVPSVLVHVALRPPKRKAGLTTVPLPVVPLVDRR